jgi:hypothetical protein
VKMREVSHESLVLQSRLSAALEALAATKVAVAELPPAQTMADVIATNSAAMEAVTAAMRANDVITFTPAEVQGRLVTHDFPAAMEITRPRA